MPSLLTLLLRRRAAAPAPGPAGGGLPPPFWGTDPFTQPADAHREDVFAAVVAWFKAEADLARVFPGGILDARAPAAVRFPYARVLAVAPNQPVTAEDTGFEVFLAAYGRDADECKRAADALAEAFTGDARPALLFAYRRRPWRESAVREVGEARLDVVGMAPGGLSRLWRWDQAYELLATLDLDPAPPAPPVVVPRPSLVLFGPSPATGFAGSPSGPFGVALLDGAASVVVRVTFRDGGAGGSFAPAYLDLAAGSPSGTFAYTPASAGAVTVTVTDDAGIAPPPGVPYLAGVPADGAAALTLSAPSPAWGEVGRASGPFAVALVNGPISGVVRVTPHDGGAGGSFAPAFLDLTAAAPTGTFAYTPRRYGTATVTVADDGGINAPAGVPYLAKIQLGGSNTVGAVCPDLGGIRLTGIGDPYYQDVTAAAVHPRSAAILASMVVGDGGEGWPNFLNCLVHPTHYGFPFVVVPEGQTLVPVDYDPTYGFPQFGVGTAPLPDSFPVEGTAAGDPTPTGYPNDQHGIAVVRDETTGGIKEVYELYSVFRPTSGSHWTVSRLAWRYTAAWVPEDRPDGMPSTTAGGTRILPGLIQYDDVFTRGVIDHALRMTCLGMGGTHVYPARANASGDVWRVPEGARLRLKASFDISGFSAPVQVILRALKKYGAVVDDNGANFQLQGTRDARWLPAVAGFYQFVAELSTIVAPDAFEVLDWNPGYILTPPSPASGPAGVASGLFTVTLGPPAANVGVNGGDAAGFTLVASVPGGSWTVNGSDNYRVSLDSNSPTAAFRYTPPAGTPPGTVITLSFPDNTVTRPSPADVAYTVT